MTIELHCHHCGKSLKTSADRAGRQATCPGCFQLITIPPNDGSKSESANPSPDDAWPTGSTEPAGTLPKADSKLCPKCSAQVPHSAIRCEFCGAVFESTRPRQDPNGIRREIRPFPPGEVIAEAWRIYTERCGILTGALLVNGTLSAIAISAGRIPLTLAVMFYDEDQTIAAIIAAVAGMTSVILAAAFVAYLHSGYVMLQLKAAREIPLSWSDLFSGRHFAIRMLINSLAFSAMISIGTTLCVVPGVFVALIFWPYAYILVDQNPPGLGSLSQSIRMTSGNWGSIFILGCVALLSILSGYCACLIGLIVAVPFVSVLFAIAYDRMSCQTEPDKFGSPESSFSS